MKEDRLDKEIAASLKKKLIEASVPYELGAWEGFQKKRARRNRKAIAFWASGIAASLLLIAVGINSVEVGENGIGNPTEIKVAENAVESPETKGKEASSSSRHADSDAKGMSTDQKLISANADVNQTTKSSKVITILDNQIDSKKEVIDSDPVQIEELAEKGTNIPQLHWRSVEKAVAQVVQESNTTQELSEKANEGEKSLLEKESPVIVLAEVKDEDKNTEAQKDKFVAEGDFPVIEKDKTSIGLGMGLSPGFGAIQSDNQVATASSLGLGMLVDFKLPGKLTLGSGLGLNYYNQNAKQESMMLSLGNTYPQTEKLEIQQMQVEVPVFVKYPVTRNNSVSVQAGFSNFYSLNGTASQEFTVQRQSAFYANDALGNSSVSLRQEAVVENNSLDSKSGRFYPFATLNFGVNLRVLETKGANYVIMPFYNYQLKQISGYGDTYGLFGASFKMNFGGVDK